MEVKVVGGVRRKKKNEKKASARSPGEVWGRVVREALWEMIILLPVCRRLLAPLVNLRPISDQFQTISSASGGSSSSG